MLTVIVRFAPPSTGSGDNASVAVDWSSSVTVTVAEAGDPMLYVEGVTPVNVAVTVTAPWATISVVVINVSSTLPVDDAGIITLLWRAPVVRGGTVGVTLTLSVRSSAGGGSAFTLNCTSSPSSTEGVTAVMVTEFAGGGGLMMTVPGMTGPVVPVVEPPSVGDAVTVTEAEAAGPTV